jgi:hypothetical protein
MDELVVALELSSVGESVAAATWATIAFGVVSVVAVALLCHPRLRPTLPPAKRHILLAVALALPLVGGFWVLDGGGVTLRFQLNEESRFASIVAAFNESVHWDQGCSSGYHLPPLPGLGRLEQVCTQSGTDPQVEFDGPGYNEGVGLAYVWSPKAGRVGTDECVIHLDGPWWALTWGQNGTACPVGWGGVGGG